MRNKYIQAIEAQQTRKDIPKFTSGDTVIVSIRVVENNKARVQHFEGVVIRVKGSGLSQTFTVRKMSYGIGVEKVFPINSPAITKIEFVKQGKVRRARIYYMRERSGKSARIKEAL